MSIAYKKLIMARTVKFIEIKLCKSCNKNLNYKNYRIVKPLTKEPNKGNLVIVSDIVNRLKSDASLGDMEKILKVYTNKNNKINTWAVFWYATIFKQNGLCLNPSQTYVENIGHDGSGIHCGESDSYSNTLSSLKNINISCTLSENQLAFQKIQYFYKKQKKSLLVRVINKLSRIIFKRNIIK